MSPKSLSTRSLLDLLVLFEQSDSPILDADGNRLYGVPGWTVAATTSLDQRDLTAWSDRVGYSGSYSVPHGDERTHVDLQETEDPNFYSYRCPETFRMKRVGADAVAVFDVNTNRLLNELADLLNIAQVLRARIQKPRIERKLWNLGDARIGPALTPVWLVRGLSAHVDEVYQSLLDTRLPDQGLILSAGHDLPPTVRPPRHYRVAYLRDALVDYSPMPRLDVHYLERILTSNEDGIKPSALPVEFANGVLRIRTKTDTWTVKGEHQPLAVAYMYEQARQGRWELDASEILAAAYPARRTEEDRKGLKMQDLFKGNDKWREFIANPTKGKYAFNLS
ncbi:hypothetical protein [Massilia putida]|uniref:hypothetical protein n=1 Tax=Massilia putida TaxID=1141883 RepID=UPI000950FCFD|nr:hypothetical protein [Massilia putida]